MNARETRLINTANRALENQGYFLVVEKLPKEQSGQPGLIGRRFAISGQEKTCVIFAVFSGGIPASCLAVLSEDCMVEEMIPLSKHSQKILARMPDDILNIYKHRIEAAESRLRGREQNEPKP
jgi:hypothetical protein